MKKIIAVVVMFAMLCAAACAESPAGTGTDTKEATAGVPAAGSTVTFGHYEQDNDTSNGAEAIEWRVLAQDGDNFILISEYGLDAVVFNQNESDGNDWSTSYIRDWLNGTFCDTAFTSDEQALLEDSVTGDKVYLPSKDEAEEYFSAESDRVCYPTVYAITNGAWENVNGRGISLNAGLWWLRTAGAYSISVAVVYQNGEISSNGYAVYSDIIMVRPVVVVSGTAFNN